MLQAKVDEDAIWVLPERGNKCVSESRRPDERRDPVRFLVSLIRLGLRLLNGVTVRISDEVTRRGLRRGALEVTYCGTVDSKESRETWSR